VLEATYRYGLDYIVRPPYPTVEGIAEILSQTDHPKARTARAEEFIDLTLVKSLEEAAFLAARGDPFPISLLLHTSL
jgi:hypothetical protein